METLLKNKSESNLNRLDFFSLLYLTTPFFLFALGWLQWWCSIPLILFLIFSLFIYKVRYYANNILKETYIHHYKSTIPVLLIFALYLFMTGMSGNWQQHTDYYVRNDIFYDLIFKSWPPSLDDGRYFIYYFQTWLPAALIGKITSWNVAQWAYYCWSLIGILLSICYIFKLVGRYTFYIGLFFMAWNGLELFPCALTAPWLQDISIANAFSLNDHVGGSYISESTCFSIKNCAHCFIPLSIICAMVYQKSTRGSFAHILGVLAVMYSPMASIVFFPILAFLYLRDFFCNDKYSSFSSILLCILKDQLTTRAICSYGAFFLLILPYYSSGEGISGFDVSSILTAKKIILFLVYTLFNCIIAAVIIRKNYKDNFLWVILIVHILCILIGSFYHLDVSMKGTVITHYFLALLFCKSFCNENNQHPWPYYLYICISSLYFIHMTGAAASVIGGVFVWILLQLNWKFSLPIAASCAIMALIVFIINPPCISPLKQRLSGEKVRYSKTMGIYQKDGGSGLWWWYRNFPYKHQMPFWFKH